MVRLNFLLKIDAETFLNLPFKNTMQLVTVITNKYQSLVGLSSSNQSIAKTKIKVFGEKRDFFQFGKSHVLLFTCYVTQKSEFKST